MNENIVVCIKLIFHTEQGKKRKQNKSLKARVKEVSLQVSLKVRVKEVSLQVSPKARVKEASLQVSPKMRVKEVSLQVSPKEGEGDEPAGDPKVRWEVGLTFHKNKVRKHITMVLIFHLNLSISIISIISFNMPFILKEAMNKCWIQLYVQNNRK